MTAPKRGRKARDEAFPWGEFLQARKDMIVYFRNVEKRTWADIARTLSCDSFQVELIYGEVLPRKAKKKGGSIAK
jgi:hypothetical protein